ncbi:MAG: hypothetical protein GVY06_04340 [Alphaproteobacteria bacterium]|jgi:type IV pilus biogenesis protein CpaD/CtpE|nr:hypothetical protein [Alphaproteobacteria bacterium]
MTRLMKLALVAALIPAAGCASRETANVAILGAASEHNLRQQAIRPLDALNMKGVEGGSGGRAGQAVAALRDGKSEDLQPMGTN